MTSVTLDYQGRTSAIVASLPEVDIDCLVVTKNVNLRYLTGFTGSHGIGVLRGDAIPLLITDGRYRDQAAAELDAAGIEVELCVESLDIDGVLAAAVGDYRRVGLEASSVSWATQQRYAEKFVDAELVAVTNLIESRRMHKEPGEIALIERAAGIADAALAGCVGELRHGPTEADFAFTLEVAMRRLGADGPSFETIVASGPNAALPHLRPTNRHIAHGDLVVVDFGALCCGYHSDMTRTLCVGAASAPQRRLYDAVLAAQRAGRAAVRAGVATKDVDAAARAVIGDAGWADQFTHGTGHGIGLEVHEAPMLSRTTPGELDLDAVVTVEPGVYLPAFGGVRIEDTVVVERDGCRSLTRFPKDLEI